MPLTAPSVSYTDIEATTLELWREWLAGWFDGGAHAIGDTAAVTFPVAVLRFEQSALSQPQDGIGISVVMLNPTDVGRKWEVIGGERQEMAQGQVTFHCWVRASGKMPDSAKPDWHARRAAQLLYAILVNSAGHHTLAQKGVMRIRPRPPEAVVEKEFATRFVRVQALLRYPVLSQV